MTSSAIGSAGGEYVDELHRGSILGGVRLDERVAAKAKQEAEDTGQLWRATNLILHRPVAVKVLSDRLRGNGRLTARIQREAAIATHIECEHLVRVLRCAASPQTGPYIVMEFVEGLKLPEYLAWYAPLPIHEAATIIAQLCVALEVMHAAGLAHREVKPANIVMEDPHRRLCAKLVDFGIETHGGAADAQAEALWDLWSLALVAYRCVAGCAADRAAFAPPGALRADVPAGLDAWFRASLAPDRSARFASAREMREALLSACAPFPLAEPSRNTSGVHVRVRRDELAPAQPCHSTG